MKSFRSLCAAAILCAAGMTVSAHAADLLRHVVCIKFKEGTKPEDIKKVEEAFYNLKNKVSDYVLSLEWGTNVSRENKDKGFTHCFVLTFASEKDLKSYIAHPDHKAFGAVLGPVMDDVFVFDFHRKE